MTFQVGDYVACVTADAIGDQRVEVGAVYVVSEVIPGPSDCTLCGPTCRGDALVLVGQPTPDNWYWCSTAFRPIYRPKQELIRSLASMLPLRVLPDLAPAEAATFLTRLFRSLRAGKEG